MKDAGNPSPSGRLVFVDGLRSLACLAVVVSHLSGGALQNPIRVAVTTPIWNILQHGWLGVQVFFVLSGFVISHSLRTSTVTPKFAANFLARRSLRLDPAYWLTIMLSLALFAISAVVLNESARAVPSASEIALNFLYVQQIAGFPSIVGVAWTLCIEVQFYVVYIFTLTFAETLAPRATSAGVRRSAISLLLLAPVAAVSVAAATGCVPLPQFDLREFCPVTAVYAVIGGILLLRPRRTFLFAWAYVGLISLTVVMAPRQMWYVQYWVMFAMGDLVARATRNELPGVAAAGFAIAVVVLSIAIGDIPAAWHHTGPLAIGVAGATALTILLCGWMKRLHVCLGNRKIQYFGAISYSLYLVHVDVGGRVANVGLRLTGDSVLAALGWAALAFVTSVAVAHLLYRWVERPTHRLSQRLKPGPVAELPISGTVI